MRSSRVPITGILTGSIALAAALTLALAGSAMPANAATVNYVALGDSYSSGVGAGNYYSSSGSCDRSGGQRRRVRRPAAAVLRS
jgi:nitrous oxidase accessory protein NosD